MERVLLVCESEKGIAFFTDFLSKSFEVEISLAHNGDEAKRLMIERDFSICMIDAPLRNEFGENLSIHIAEKALCQVILVVGADKAEAISEKVEDYGVITVSKPVSLPLLWNALKLAIVSQRRINMMQRENDKLNKRLEDMKIVNRAKCVLISYMGMTEEEAHRYIEKNSMDRRITRKEFAEMVIEKYEQ